MADEFDTVIIGAGVGGLTAAAKLVSAGQHILVIDRNPHVGGTCYVYQRQGFRFPMGPLGFSNRKIVEDILEEEGVDSGLNWKRISYVLKAFSLDVPLSASFAETVKILSHRFPRESHAIETFFRDISELISFLKCPDGGVDSTAANYNWQISSADYLDAHVHDWRLRRILGSIGTCEPYSGLPLLAAMWDLIGNEGIWYPAEGLQSFCQRLLSAVTGDDRHSQTRDAGKHGAVQLGMAVNQIRIENGTVTGVILADGTKVNATHVISNADYKTTFLKLLAPGTSEEWQNTVSKARQTGSILQVCLGLDKSMVDLSAFHRASRVIYRRNNHGYPSDENIRWDVPVVDPDALSGQELEISLWSNEDASLAPDGGAVVVIRAEAPYSHFTRFHPIRGHRTPDYAAYKEQLGRALIVEVGKLIPGLEKAVKVMDVATPLTFADQGGRSEGAVAGWSWDYRDFHDYRPRELVLTPLKGLYLAGYQAFSALFTGGVPTAMKSGLLAARAVLDNAGPVTGLNIL